MATHLILRLKAPIASVGAVSGEEHRGAGEAPTRSMVLGLLGNAMGLDRTIRVDMERLNALDAGVLLSVMMFGMRTLADGDSSAQRFADTASNSARIWSDTQNARVGSAQPEDVLDRLERGGRVTDDPSVLLEEAFGALANDRLLKFMKKPVRRRKDYLLDFHALVSRSPVGEWPESPDALAHCLRHPARTLWIGRKACPPSAPVAPIQSLVEAPDGVQALLRSLGEGTEKEAMRRSGGSVSVWWQGDPVPGGAEAKRLGLEGGFATMVLDRRDWVRGLHVGASTMMRGAIRLPIEKNHET